MKTNITYKVALILLAFLLVQCSRGIVSTDQPLVYEHKINRTPNHIVVLVVNGIGFNHLSAIGETSSFFNEIPYVGILNHNLISQANHFERSHGLFNKSDDIHNSEESLLSVIRKSGKSTGIISMNSLSSPVNQSFLGLKEPNIDTLHNLYSESGFSLIIGGGGGIFPAEANSKEFAQLRDKGYRIHTDYRSAQRFSGGNVIGILDDESVKPLNLGRPDDFFRNISERVIMRTSREARGSFFLIENTHPGNAAESNNSSYYKSELINLNEGIGVLTRTTKSRGDVLLLIVSAYESGGLNLTDAGDISWSKRGITNLNTPVFAIGPGAEIFAGTYGQDQFYEKLKRLIK